MRRCALFGAVGLVLMGCADSLPAPVAQVAHEAPVAPPRAYAFPVDTNVAVAAQRAAPPLSLTASDGTGLRLAEMSVNAVVEDPLAFTELHLVFDNPEDRRLEGTFTITLPEGAALSRFSMKLGDEWQEGEIVEKQAARKAYEDFLHRRQDPALLEQAPGNQFSARVFPIPARGRKELIVSYSQELPNGKPFSIPLRGLPELGRLSLAVSLAEGGQVEQLDQKNVTPSADYRLDARSLRGGAGLRSGDLALVRVRPIPAAEPDPLASTLVLVDTSASRALGFEEQARLIGRIARRIADTSGPRTPFALGAFDQTTDAIFEGEAGSFGEGDLRRLRERQAFGASNLSTALAWAEVKAKAGGYKRVLLVGDGVATAGDTDPSSLATRASRLKASGVERLDAIVMGGLRDEAALRRLTTGTLQRDGVVVDGAVEPEVLTRKLTLATRSGIDVAIEGARWQWPRVLDGVQSGDEVLVYAEVPELPEGQPLRVTTGSVTSSMELTRVSRPLLERSWAKAKIGSLLEARGDTGPKSDIARQVIELSTKHRVLSSYTSLLVLETDRDYARFHIDRKALADVLTVDGGKLAFAKRGSRLNSPPVVKQESRVALAPKTKALPVAKPTMGSVSNGEAQEARTLPMTHVVPFTTHALGEDDAVRDSGNVWGSEIGDSFGAGGLGLTGVGEGGGGRGEGIGLGHLGITGHSAGTGTGHILASSQGTVAGSHRSPQPQIRQGATQVTGRLPPDVIQRIVRQNFGRFRLCYEEGLRQQPNLQGRISVRFAIAPDGSVASSALAVSELGPSVGGCVARAFVGLSFPAPESGSVIVTYPISFAPEGTALPSQGALSPATSPPPEPPVVNVPPPKVARADPYTGRFKSVMDLLGSGGTKPAIDAAYQWHNESPGDVMALVALGQSLEVADEKAAASRVYGSIVDLFPARADLRRFAGERMERLGDIGRTAALDTFAKALEERPDHPESHRLVAYARLRNGDYEGAFGAITAGMKQPYPAGRFAGIEQILKEDLGLVAAAWINADPTHADDIRAKLVAAGGFNEDAPSLRFVLSWETDANDVDFHIHDAEGGHAFYQHKTLESGGQLYADVTTGYGPECFTIRLPREKRSARYDLEAHYYSRGPMGYGMGKVEIIDHDGAGGLTFEERPFIVMTDGAFVDLGTWPRTPTAAKVTASGG